jgi:hypothetical protein
MTKIKKLINILLLVSLFLSIFALDYYLKTNNYLFYSTGTNKKAFVNATWEMSPNEVRRANNADLVPAKYRVFKNLLYKLGPDDAGEMGRYELMECEKHIVLWGFKTKVQYVFFDDRLFEYTVFVDGYDSGKMNNAIISALTEKYGNGLTGDNKAYLHSMEWETRSERVDYWIIDIQDKVNTKTFLAGVRISYKPMFGIFSKMKRKSSFLTWTAILIDAILPPDFD